MRRLLVLVLLLGACSAPPRPEWAPVALPGTGPVVLRDAVDCGGRFYLTGAAGGGPAAWDSADGLTWRRLTFQAEPTSLYGPLSTIFAVGCADGRVAMAGAASGGVHGNPRVSTWRQRPDGNLAEVSAGFELYGGNDAVNVARIAGGPSGFVIAGNRISGAAAWLSPDGTEFTRHDGSPALAAGRRRALARDAAVAPDGHLVLVGGAAAFESPDGTTWTRTDVAGDLQRVVRTGDGLVAVGRAGSTLAAWDGSWRRIATFGTAAEVTGLAATGTRLLAATATGLWTSADGTRWAGVDAPAGLTAVTGRGNRVVLAGADRAWTGTLG